MMIKINDEFSMDRDKYQWILHQTYMGRNKITGEPKPQSRQTYYSRIDQIAKAIIDKSLKRCDTAEDILSYLSSAEAIVTKDLEELV